MRVATTLLSVLYCLTFNHLAAQPEEYLFSHVDVTYGLSNNHITSIYKDARGFMWFGTVSGLNRYDGYQTRVFKHDPRDPHSIADNYIEQIFEGPGGKMWVESRKERYNIYDACLDRWDVDYAGYLRKLGLPTYELLTIAPSKNGYWFIYRDSGLYHYGTDGKIRAFRPRDLSGLPVVAAREDGNGNCWVVHENGLLEEIDGRQNKVVFRMEALENEFGKVAVTPPCRLFIDAQDDLWLFSNGVFKGAYYYHPPTHELRHFALDEGERRLNSNIVLAALQDKKGLIWLATDHGGVDIVDKRNFSVKFIGHVEDDNKSIAENNITALYRDSGGTVWLGTFKSGISLYHQDNFQFPQYRHEPNRPGTLPFEDVNSFAEDAAGNIWIGGNSGGLLYFDRKKNTFKQWLHDPNNPNSLCSNIIVSLLLDKEGRLWIGTYFGGLDCFDGQHFTHYRHDDNDPYSLADDRVMCLCEDRDGQLWVGTLAAGMDRLDRRRKVFYHYRANLPHSIHNNYVSSIITDEQDNLWIATGWGIDVIEKNTDNIRHYSVDYNQLSSDNVTWLYMDSKQRIWAATREGLDVLCPDEKIFQVFTTEDGLPDNTIRDIEEDSLHRLWVSTANGLSRITVVSPGSPGDRASLRIRCRNFHEQDGLQGREFNERSGLETRDGALLFGGPNGFNIFRPEDITPDRKEPPIVLTGLEVFDKSVRVGDQTAGHTILQKALSETGKITLTHRDNVFSIEFASLGYIPNATNRYAYKLDGFNNNWLITDGKIRKATYTNLDAGDYTFRVKASDEDGQWYDKEAVLKITVLPPWWKTEVAYIVYILMFAASLLLARRMVLIRAKMRFALENERRETRRMHEMDLMKIRFFTNMSHELRTPLSLILAPVDKLLANGPQPDSRRQYDMIRRNARRLLHLVNQLLDFRKMEEGELRLHLREGDVMRFVRDTALSFVDLAERKNIAFSLKEEGGVLITRFDHDKLERILFNLLSNAFKFTPEKGSVTVVMRADRSGGAEDEVILSIAIADTGIGIEPDKQGKIFERFFQNEVPDTILNQGSGIGLSITQEFVRMHGGRLTVESEVNKGSCFTVALPFREMKTPGAQWIYDGEEEEEGADPLLPVKGVVKNDMGARAGNAPKGAPTILIVEDNEDFRFYLKDNLRDRYKIIEASDGKEGWKKVLSAQPQLVVSDISMPHMDGIQLCRKIRTDERTKQIPVILLTAMSGETIELEGLQTGATDYISKPFNFEVLLSKIRNVVEYNETVRKTWQRRVEAGPTPVEMTSPDEVFLREVLAYIEQHIADPDLSVEALSQQLHASRSTFYKRLVLLTGKTPVELIRHIRLQRAAELLEKSQLTVAEIAYTVGFNNPKYFTQYFKSAFDCIPSAYRAGKKMAKG